MGRVRRWLLPPYQECQANGVYFGSSTGRYFVKIFGPGPGEFVFTQYARYLLEVSLGRKLGDGMTVDHIDGDRTNDLLGNLAEMSQSDNSKKSVQGRVVVDVPCTSCKEILRVPRTKVKAFLPVTSKSWVPFISCGRTCGNKLAYEVKGMTIDEKIAFRDVAMAGLATVQLARETVELKHTSENFMEFSLPLSPGDTLISTDIGVPNGVFTGKRAIKKVYKSTYEQKEMDLQAEAYVGRMGKVCPICQRSFTAYSKQVYCGYICMGKAASAMPSGLTKESLLDLVTRHSFTKVAEMLGVSDNGVRKWCKKFGIDPKQIRKDKLVERGVVECALPGCANTFFTIKGSKEKRFCSATCGSRSRAIDK